VQGAVALLLMSEVPLYRALWRKELVKVAASPEVPSSSSLLSLQVLEGP